MLSTVTDDSKKDTYEEKPLHQTSLQGKNPSLTPSKP